jgi:tetratricopeptide (TPR) repeat protein
MTALQLAQENGCLEVGIEIARTLVKVLSVEAEIARILEAQRILIDLHVRAGQVGQAVNEWMALAERMEDENRWQQAISAYLAARDLATQYGESLLKAEAAFALGLLLESCDDLDPAFEAMSDAATALLEMQLPGNQQRIIALPVAINCARLARRRSDDEEEAHWARIAGEIARERPDAAFDVRAHAVYELGVALWGRDPVEAIQSFVTAGHWFEEAAQFGNAAISAESAARLALREDKQGFLRIATERWAQTMSPEEGPRQAAALVKLSAVLAEDKNLRGAVEAISEAITVLPDDASYASQALELRMRHAALRLLSGTSPKQVDFGGIRDAGSAVELSKQAALLEALDRGALSVADARDVLYDFVCDDPRYEPPGHTAWLHGEMGKPAEAEE